MNNFHIDEEIGKTKESIVYKGRKNKTIDYYALKSVPKTARSKIVLEVKFLHMFDHPHIVKFFNWYETTNHFWLVFELCAGGTLSKMIHQDLRFPESTVHMLARDIISALNYLHCKDILVTCILPSSILLNAAGVLKLTGFSRARYLHDTRRHDSPQEEIPYTAPEVLQGAQPTIASDLWSLGCILFELASGMPPFRSLNSILRDPVPHPPSGVSQSFGSLVSCLLVKDPAARMTWPQLLAHSFWRPALDLSIPRSAMPVIEEALPSTSIPEIPTTPAVGDGAPIEEDEEQEASTPPAQAQEQEKMYSTIRQSIDQRPTTAPSVTSPKDESAPVRPSTPSSDAAVLGLLYHSSEDTVRPIVANKRIEKYITPTFDARALSFRAPPPAEFVTATTESQENIVNSIIRSIANQAPVPTRTAALGYLCVLASAGDAANLLINSTTLLPTLIRLVRAFKSGSLRARLVDVLGLLLRWATRIDDLSQVANLSPTLVELERDQTEGVRRRAVAGLGELVFYAATQPKAAAAWSLAGPIQVLVTVLRTGEDRVVQHYAAKTVENVALQQGSPLVKQFATPAVVSNLLKLTQLVYPSPTDEDALALTAVSAVSRLIRQAPSLSETVFSSKLGVSLDYITQSLATASGRLRQAWLTVLCQTILYKPSLVLPLPHTLIRAIVRVAEKVDSGSNDSICRAKAFLTLHLFSSRGGLAVVAAACQAKIVPIIDRALKSADEYTRTCAGLLLSSIAESISPIIERAYNMSHDDVETLFPVVVHGMSSAHIRAKAATPRVVNALAGLFSRLFIEGDDTEHPVMVQSLMTAETLTQLASKADISPSLQRAVSDTLLPAVLSLGQRSTGEVRAYALRIVGDASSELLTERVISCVEDLLPVAARFLEDNDPIPAYTLKLFGAVAEVHKDFAMEVANHPAICTTLAKSLEDDATPSLYGLRLLRIVLELEGEGAQKLFTMPDLANGLARGIERAWKSQADEFLEPLLSATYAFLFPCSTHRMSDQILFGQMQRAGAPIAGVTRVLCQLLIHEDLTISDAASACLLLLSQSQPSSHPQLIASSDLLAQAIDQGGEVAIEVVRTLRWAVAQHETESISISQLKAARGLTHALSAMARHEDPSVASAAIEVLRALQ